MITSYPVPQESAPLRRGRPRFVNFPDQLEFMRSSFTWTYISSLLVISRMTFFCRRVEFQMLTESSSIVDDRVLRTIVSSDIPNVAITEVLPYGPSLQIWSLLLVIIFTYNYLILSSSGMKVGTYVQGYINNTP